MIILECTRGISFMNVRNWYEERRKGTIVLIVDSFPDGVYPFRDTVYVGLADGGIIKFRHFAGSPLSELECFRIISS